MLRLRAGVAGRRLSGVLRRGPSSAHGRWLCAAAARKEPQPQDASADPRPQKFWSSSAVAEDFLGFQDPVYERFVNIMMMDGKKQTARKLLWRALGRIRDSGHDPLTVFHGALENVLPMMEMRSSRSGGSGMVPFPLTPKRAEGVAMKWIVGAARKRNASSQMDARLSHELLQAYQNKGTAVGRRETVHKMALANQAAAHFRWRGGAREPGSVNIDSRKQYRPLGRRSVKRLQRAFLKAP